MHLEREILSEVEILLRNMEKGARHRNTEKNHPGGSESQEADSGGGGGPLKKEIGLVSACAIIVGESNSFSPTDHSSLSGGPSRTLIPQSPSPKKHCFCVLLPLEKGCHSPVLSPARTD